MPENTPPSILFLSADLETDSAEAADRERERERERAGRRREEGEIYCAVQLMYVTVGIGNHTLMDAHTS